MPYDRFYRLRGMSKADLVAYIKPLVKKSVKINECWVDGEDGKHPTDRRFNEIAATSEVWASLRDLHDDYGEEPWKQIEKYKKKKKKIG